MNTPQWVIVHHSAISYTKNSDQWKATNQNHKERFNFPARNGEYGGYHLELNAKGEVHRFRQDDEVGAHCKEQRMNFKSIGICLDMNGDVEEPTMEQKKALLHLITEYQEKYHIPDDHVVPHRYFAGPGTLKGNYKTFTGKPPYKSCWGSKLPDDIINYLKPFASMPSETPAIVPEIGKAEMEFFMNLYGVHEKNLSQPAPWGEVFVILKRMYDSLKK